MNRLLPFLIALLSLGLVQGNSTPPNLLLIIADDCTYRDLEVYGGQARTPHLKKLAAEGIKMTRCFQAAPMCSPTRHCLYTGLYPVKSGAYPNHTFAHDWVKSIAHYLQGRGYTTHLSGKTHINPASVFPFEYSSLKGEGNPDPAVFEQVLKTSAKSQKPFLFIAASNEPHEPYTKGDPSAYPPASLTLPPIWVDTSETREDYSKYLAEITYFDSQVGELIGLLDENGQRENTLVFVLSEQGNSFPFAKWTCYDVGLQSACIARWPGQVKPGSESAALIEYVDIVPTFLEAVGIPRPEVLDGRSFLPVLKGEAAQHKKYVFGLQTTLGINNGSHFYGVRSVRDSRYRYIRNFTPEVKFECAATHSAFYESWQRLAKDGDSTAQALVTAYEHRPAEELYDCQEDPWNRKNLIADENLPPVRQALRNRLDAWMQQQGDQGQATEMSALERMPRSHKEPKKAKKKKPKAQP